MSFDALIGQQPAKDYLRSVMSSGRRGHAFLFRGPVGVGKRTAAYLFAQHVLCFDPSASGFCGKCKSCHWFANRRGAMIDHPDVINLLKPGNANNPLVGDHEPIIPMETAQYVCEQLHRSPQAGRYRAAIIPEAQRLCRGQAEAANAFLKTLEEPPASSLIILTSSQPEGLLETIVSRVQAVQFRRLSTEDVRRGLSKQAEGGAGETELDLVAHLCDGSLGHAKDLLQGDLKKWRTMVLPLLQSFDARACPQFGVALWALADEEGKRLFAAEREAAKAAGPAEEEAADDAENEQENEAAAKTESGWKRYVFRRMLELCEVSFRDGMIVAAAKSSIGQNGGDSDSTTLLLQPDQVKLADTIATRFGADGCIRALAAITEALRAVRLYVRGDVVGRALAGQLVEAMNK